MIQIEWENPDTVRRQLAALLTERAARVRQIPETAIRKGAFVFQAKVARLAPYKTGTLKRSIHAKFTREPDGDCAARIGTWLLYAPYIEYGTGIFGPKKRPFEVVAKRAKALFWGAKDGGRKGSAGLIFRKRVRIQGMRARRPFGRAMEAFLPEYAQIVEREVAKLNA